MLREYVRAVTALVMAIDLAIVAGAFVIAHWLRAVALPALGIVSRPFYPLDSYLPLLPLALLLWGVLLWRSGEYRSHRTVPLPRELLDLMRVSVMGGTLLVLAIYLLRLDHRLLEGDTISRAWIVLFTAVAFSGLAIDKLALRWMARLARTRGYNFRTILIVGTSAAGLAIADAIRHHRHWGYRLLGFLAEDRSEGTELGGSPVLGVVEDLGDVVLEWPIDEVICATRSHDEERDRSILEQLRELGICVRFVLGSSTLRDHGPRLSDLGGVPLVTYAAGPVSPAQSVVKRLFDIAGSGLLLAVLAPGMALIALSIKLGAPGPVFFRQRRLGLNGRGFSIHKFRTMVVGAENRRGQLQDLNEMDGPTFKIRRDPRVTPVGRFLRRFSLDELPQLWNVLRGDMSLVGPRPMRPDEAERLERWERRRLSMRPGITCLWAVEGRNDLGWGRGMALDMEYIDSCSPWLDLKILLRTIPAVVSGRGAS